MALFFAVIQASTTIAPNLIEIFKFVLNENILYSF